MTVFGERMAYVEMGKGRPIVFLHGNPTSSYIWRNIVPHVEHFGRCIAPDMIGMGDSAKLPNAGPGVYTYSTHRRYLFELLRLLQVDQNILFVLHDWGSALGFDYASRHPAAVRGIAFSAPILRVPNAAPTPPANNGLSLFQRLQTSEGEQLVLQENAMVDKILIGGLQYYLSTADEAEYRRPYLAPGADRWPTLQWPRELPANSAGNARIIDAYSSWLVSSTTIPKLFLHSIPGDANPQLLQFMESFPNQKEVTIFGPHFVQEVSPNAYGRALAEWIQSIA